METSASFRSPVRAIVLPDQRLANSWRQGTYHRGKDASFVSGRVSKSQHKVRP
jgi:hypothetical protein